MHCPRCHADNRDGRRFCTRCGAGLPRSCAACGFLNEADDEFCGGCGQVLPGRPAVAAPAAGEAPAGERRQATILFADLAGFTRMTNDLGAESMYRMLNTYLSAFDELVGGYGGSVEYIGDAVMAIFGAPVAHGDDPVRALRVAGDMHNAMASLSAELGRPLQVHIGVASGEVVAAGLGRDGKAKHTVIGDSVNLASRLSDLAQPGETLISDAVQRALDRRVRCQPAGDVAVKGFDHPLRVWRVAAYAAETASPQFDTPFVGRRAELRQFAGILEACHETRTGQAVLLRGEAGIGKTRLAAEFAALAGARGFACHKGLVLDFGTGKGQDAIGALTRSVLAIPPGAGKEIRIKRAEGAVAAGLVETGQRVFLNDLLDVPQAVELRALVDAMDGAMRQLGREAIVAALVRRSAAQMPILLLIEDIHWADAPMLAMIASLARAVGDCPAVLALTSRIDGDPVDAAWRARAGNGALSIIDLGPLRTQEAQTLAAGLVGQNAGLIDSCIERAEGNPLFLEQLLRNSEESAGATMPGSIQSLVLARMDRLSPADKHALQAAAVVGQRFTLDALRAVVRDERYDPAALLRHRLIRPEADAFLFSHALIRDGVYGSLLSDARRELHRRAAAFFDRRDAVLTAQHLDLAEDPAAPAAYLDAARAQAAGYNNARALQLVERGLAVARQDADKCALSLLHGELLQDVGDTGAALAAYRQARSLAASDAERCGSSIGIAACLHVTDQYEEALAALADAEAIASAGGLGLELARLHHLRGSIHFPRGRIDECLLEHEVALRYARECGSPAAQARALSGLADAAYMQGRFLTAHAHFTHCVEIARRHGLGRIEVANLNMAAITRLYTTLDLAATRADCVRAIDAAARVGSKRAEMIAHHCLYLLLYIGDDLAGAMAQAQRALELSLQIGARRFEAESLTFMAEVKQATGSSDEAEQLLGKALVLSRQTGMLYMGPWILGMLAGVTSDPIRRVEALAEAESLLAQGAVSHNYLWFYPNAASIALAAGDADGAERSAAALENYMRPEPTPYSDFHIAWIRALAAVGRGYREDSVRAELQRIRDWARDVGYVRALASLDRALAAW